jgi:hypothetical protein
MEGPQLRRSFGRWYILGLICLMYLITYLDRVNISTAAPVISKEFGFDKVTVGIIFSAFVVTEVINHEVRLRRAKYLGALADRIFRDECARLGLNADEAIKSPLLSIITRQGGQVVIAGKRSRGQPDGWPS